MAVGIATGAITVATAVFAQPAVPYIQALRFERDRLMQALGLLYTLSTVALAAALAHAGEMRMSLAWPSLVALGTALIGMWLGQRVREQTFRLWFYLGLLVLGVHLALRGVL